MNLRVTITLACLLIAAVNIPLILGKVPPNRLYGFRTRLTLSNPEIWYPSNAFAGRAFLVSSGASIALLWLTPAPVAEREWFPVAALLVPLSVALILCFVHLRRYR